MTRFDGLMKKKGKQSPGAADNQSTEKSTNHLSDKPINQLIEKSDNRLSDKPVKRKGRPRGKRSDPNYTQVGAYIPKDLDKQVKRKLLDEDIDFSELVADLLLKWISD